jgi:hypothetical protein
MAEPVGQYEPRQLTGEEALPRGAAVRDFWRWIGSDLVGNTTRGLFAEYLVGLAVGAFAGDEADGVRDEWGAYDLATPEGVKLEVKSSAFLQSWWQRKEAAPRFGIARTQAWDDATGQSSEEKARWSDVYVFCLLHHRSKATLNPLDVGQWTFLVLSTAVLDEQVGEQRSIGLARLRDLGAKEVPFDGIADAVRKAAPARR